MSELFDHGRIVVRADVRQGALFENRVTHRCDVDALHDAGYGVVRRAVVGVGRGCGCEPRGCGRAGLRGDGVDADRFGAARRGGQREQRVGRAGADSFRKSVVTVGAVYRRREQLGVELDSVIGVFQECGDGLSVVGIGEDLIEELGRQRTVTDVRHVVSLPVGPHGVGPAVTRQGEVGVGDVEPLREPVAAAVVRTGGVAVGRGLELRGGEVRGDVAPQVHAEGEDHVAQLAGESRHLEALGSRLEHRGHGQLEADALLFGEFDDIGLEGVHQLFGRILGEGRGRENLIIVGFVAGGVDVERHGVGDDRRRGDDQRRNVGVRGDERELCGFRVGEARGVGRHGAHREGVGAALVEFRQDDRTVSGGRHLPAVDRELVEFRFGHFGPGDDGFRRIGAAERDLRLGKLLQIVGQHVDVGEGGFGVFGRVPGAGLDRHDILFLPFQTVEFQPAAGRRGLAPAVERVDVGPCVVDGFPAEGESGGRQVADDDLRLCDGLQAGAGLRRVVVRRAGAQSREGRRRECRVFIKGFHRFDSLLR